MKNFWTQLKKPVFVLAPMADVTDAAFRQIITKYGKPDVVWTEFVSADGLAHPKAREKLLVDLKYSEAERPIVAQIFGGRPENIKTAAALCRELGFDGVDINMGCPDKKVEKQCAGAACMKDYSLAKEIIRAAKEGAGGLPVSVKTRIGYNKNEIDAWIPVLLEQDIAVLTIHLRTRKEMSDVPAHWELMPRILELRDKIAPQTLIFGNGDVKDLEDAADKVKKYRCDGVMLGRAIFGNPWLFAEEQTPLHSPLSGGKPIIPPLTRGGEVGLREKLNVMLEHTKLFEELLGEHKNFAIMKKHYKAYVNGFDGAKDLRIRLMDAKDYREVEDITHGFLENLE